MKNVEQCDYFLRTPEHLRCDVIRLLYRKPYYKLKQTRNTSLQIHKTECSCQF